MQENDSTHACHDPKAITRAFPPLVVAAPTEAEVRAVPAFVSAALSPEVAEYAIQAVTVTLDGDDVP